MPVSFKTDWFVTQPNISVTPSSWSFGSVEDGQTVNKVFTVSNTGLAALSVGTIAVANPTEEGFSIVNDNVSGHILSPGASLTFTLRFVADGSGVTKNTTFDIPSNDPNDNPFVISGSADALAGGPNSTFLLHGESIVDSIGGKSISNSGVSISSAQSKFGGSSMLFNGSSSYLQMANHADFQMGTGDFTIDFWVYFNSVPAGATGPSFFSTRDGAAWTNTMFCLKIETQKLSVDTGLGNVVMSSTTVSSGAWMHMAFLRTSNTCKLFVNGIQRASNANSMNFNYTPSYVRIGGNEPDQGRYLNGYLDEFRIVKGAAVWTTDFTPPASAYTR